MKIVRKEESKPSYLSVYQIAINLIGYISLYNALIELNKSIKNESEEGLMTFVNTALIKDFSVELNELYKFSDSLVKDFIQGYIDLNPEFENYIRFIKSIRNKMKFYPKVRILDDILNRSKFKYPSDILHIYKNDVLVACGYFMGKNVIFGSNLYGEYIFYDREKYCKNADDFKKITASILNHLATFHKLFNDKVFYNNLDMSVIYFSQKKRCFRIYGKSTTFEKMVKKSKYDKLTVFIFMLLIEEISGLQIYLNYLFDLEKTIVDPIMLYFFTQYVAIKYDEIRDAIERIYHGEAKIPMKSDLLKNRLARLNIFNKETTDFAYKLRNFHHFEEVEKYYIKIKKNSKRIVCDFTDLYKLVTEVDNFSKFKEMLYKMLDDLDILLNYMRKNVGFNY